MLLKIFQSSGILYCDSGFNIADVSKDRNAFFSITFPSPEYECIKAIPTAGTYLIGETAKYPRNSKISQKIGILNTPPAKNRISEKSSV